MKYRLQITHLNTTKRDRIEALRAPRGGYWLEPEVARQSWRDGYVILVHKSNEQAPLKMRRKTEIPVKISSFQYRTLHGVIDWNQPFRVTYEW